MTASNAIISTSAIILRKTDYRESGLIVTALSPDFGRLDLILKGEKKIEKKRFPQVDLFRELETRFVDARKELIAPRGMELVREFDAIATRPDFYRSACSLAAFLPRVCPRYMPCPRTYRALAATLSRYVRGDRSAPWESLTRLVCLDEQGLLSTDDGAETPAEWLLCPAMTAAEGLGDLPAEATPRDWRGLARWARSLPLS